MKPTEAQVKEFWEWCGFIYKSGGNPRGFIHPPDKWLYPAETWHDELPSIDLNNLFKYAVPKITNEMMMPVEVVAYPTEGKFDMGFHVHLNGKERLSPKDSADPTLALFWSIYEALKEK